MAEPNNNNPQPSPVVEPNDNNVLPPPVKKTKGKRRVDIKFVEDTSKRYVTFSKRKKGLFNKAAELSILTGAETLAIVFSGKGKMFSFGGSSCDAVIQRYLAETNPEAAVEPVHHNKNDAANSERLVSMRQQYFEAMGLLEEEKRRGEMIQKGKEAVGVVGPAEFFREEIDRAVMSWEDLERLKGKAEKRAQEMIMNRQCSFTSLMDGRVVMANENYRNNNDNNISMNNMY